MFSSDNYPEVERWIRDMDRREIAAVTPVSSDVSAPPRLDDDFVARSARRQLTMFAFDNAQDIHRGASS